MTMYPNRLGLIVAVPLSGNPIVPEWAFAFHSLHPPMDYNVEFSLIRGRPVDEARNYFAKLAQEKKAKYLFFIDEDVTPPAHAIRQLIYHLEHWPKAAVAAGIYCHKSPPSMPMVFRGNGAGPYWDWKIGEVFQCSGIGMGCAMIRVDALKDIEPPYFKTIDNAEAFKDGINQGEAWTEDLFFCDKITKAGWDILADGGILPDHWDAKTHTSYNLPPTAKPLRHAEVKKGDRKVVDLGCGRKGESYYTEEGEVLRVDMREEVEPDYRCDLRQLPFGNKEFDVVFSGHTLEHFARLEVGKVLDEWIRILRDDGELRLNLPNLEWAAQHIMNKEIDDMVMNVLYGAQSYEENFHKCGFTPQIIEQLLAERGFKKFVWSFNNYHMFVRAWRNPPEKETQLVAVTDSTGFTKDRLVALEVDGQHADKPVEPPAVPVLVERAQEVGTEAKDLGLTEILSSESLAVSQETKTEA
jgi:predicted SAM-dependent methyltransferase